MQIRLPWLNSIEAAKKITTVMNSTALHKNKPNERQCAQPMQLVLRKLCLSV